MTARDKQPDPDEPARAKSTATPPKLYECKLCGKVFDGGRHSPPCPECDSNDVEQVG